MTEAAAEGRGLPFPAAPPPEFYSQEDSDNACFLCGDPRYTPLREIVHYGFPFRFQRCACGVEKQTPLPNERFFEWFFNSELFFSSTRSGSDAIWGFYDYFRDEPCRMATSRRRFRRLAPFLGGPPRDILKIGPSTGTFLHVAKEAGHRVLGCDISSEFIARARKEYGVRIDHGRFERLGYAEGSFDAVLLFNVIENVPNQDEFLREVHRVIRPGGAFILNFVDMKGNLLAAWQGPRYFLYRPPICYAFDREVMRRILGKYGFEVERTFRDLRYLHLEKIATLLGWRWLYRVASALRIHRIMFPIYAYPSRIVVARKPAG